MTWPAERDALLRQYLGEGLSTSATAAAIGITRNSVIGRAYRLGIRIGMLRAEPLKGTRSLRLAEKSAPTAKTPPPEGGVSFIDLRGICQCRFPLWAHTDRPGVDDMRFCGTACEAIDPYCSLHMKATHTASGMNAVALKRREAA